MKILQACPYSWNSYGGVQNHVAGLSHHLARRGHDVLILAPGRSDAGDCMVSVVGRPVPVPYNRSIARICPSPLSAARVSAAMRRFQPDIVHVHEPFAPSTSMFAALLTDAPLVATFHAHIDRPTLFGVAAPLLRRIWRRLDVPLAVSAATATLLLSRLGVHADVLPNGIDVGLFAGVRRAPQGPGRRLLFVGRLDQRKGFAVMVRAFASLADRLPDLSLVVIGDGRDRDAVSSLAPHVRRRVTMLGARSREEVLSTYTSADIFIAPATGNESFGVVLLEAMAAGLPVVASDIPGYREVVRHDVEGLLVRPGDAAALGCAVERILADSCLASRLARAGRARVRDFAWETLVAGVESRYAMAATRRHARGPVHPLASAALPPIVLPPD
ncbi:MAG: glycosyltransferase family 4 protein [Acidobacteriota bacterium]